MTNTRFQKPKLRTAGEATLNLTALAATAFLGAIATYNISLYQKIFSNLFELPWAWLQWLFGFSGWLLIQLVEVLPILLRNELGFMALIAIAASTFPRINVNQSNPIAKRLGDRINLTPEWWLFNSNRAATLTFGADLVFVGRHFQAIDFGSFIPRIDVGALFSTVVTVVIFQAAFILALHAWNGRWLVREGKQAGLSPNQAPPRRP